jgi:hypothetical protein
VQDFPHRATTVCLLSLLALTLGAGSTPTRHQNAVAGARTPTPPPAAVLAQLARLPLLFADGGGRASADVRYVSLGPGPQLELTDTEVRLATPASTRGERRVRLALAGGAHARSVEAEDLTPARLHDYGSKDPARWRPDLPTYRRVVYRDLYPATDLVFHGSQGRAEFDFVLRPGAAPQAIGLDVKGADRVTLEGADVVVHAGDETIRLHEPVVYQEGSAGRERVNGRFTVKGRRIGFEVAAYDRTRSLVIDPVVSYASYLGGAGDQTSDGVGLDAAGNIYVAIRTEPSSPVAAPGQIVKLSSDGQTLLYTVSLGGMNPRGLAVDPAGNAYLIGECGYGDPTCPILHPLAQGRPLSSHGDTETLITKLGPTGALLFSSPMGGDGTVVPGGINVDRAGNIYATAFGFGFNFPLTRPPYGSQGFFTVVEAIAADTSRFLWVTGIQTGGAVVDIGAPAIDSRGAVYVTAASPDMFPTTPGVIQPAPPAPDHGRGVVAKFAVDGSLVYGTFFGNEQTIPTAIAVDDDGNAYITGMAGPGLPTVNALQPALAGGATDAFVAKLNADATKLVFSTYLGGKGDDGAAAIGRDARGNVYVAGPTTSTDFPQRDPLPSRFGTAGSNFLAALTGDGSALVYSTYFADAQTTVADMHVTAAGTVYLAGGTRSAAFPTVHPFKAMLTGASDAFVAQLDPSEPSALRVIFTRPATGATVGGTVWTDVWAENFTGTSNTFTLSIGTTTVATGTGSNHVTLAWNSLAVPNGPVTLTATVRDSAGHVGTGTRSLVVANAAPLVAHFTAPAAGVTVRGTTTIGMSATGASGAPIAFTLTVDGTQRFTTSGTAATAFFSLNTTTLADGVHTLGLTVRDGADRSASTTRALTVANGPATFSVTVTSPPSGAVSSGRAWADVWLEGASAGARTFTLTIDGTVVGTATDSLNHVTIPWDTTKVANGPHVLVARVRDAAGRTGLGARDVNVQNATMAAR